MARRREPRDPTGSANDRTPRADGRTPDRRAALRTIGLAITGTTLGATTVTERATARTATETATDFDPKTWQSDAVPETPIRELSFPGTHHAAMIDTDPESPEYWDCQTRDVYAQLCDGIRFLDVRVESQGDGDETEFYGHHSSRTGRSLDREVFPQISRYLAEVDDAGASELVLLKLSHFRDAGAFSDEEFESDDWTALSDLLRREFGEYAIDLGSMTSTDELLAATPSDYDGPRIAIFHRTLDDHDSPLSLPSFTDRFADWVSSFYPDTSTPGDVLAGGVTNEHATASTLGETQWIIRAPTDLYEGGETTNAMLPLYEQVVRADRDSNPNLVRVDYYETSEVVSLCRRLSLDGLHGPMDGSVPLEDGDYSVRSVATGNVIEVANAAETDGADAVEADWTGGSHQRFGIRSNDDGTYRLEAAHSGKVLGVEEAGTDDGAAVTQQSWRGTDGQRWYAVALEDGPYCFINANSGRVLDGDQSSEAVIQWHWTGDSNQRWELVERDTR